MADERQLGSSSAGESVVFANRHVVCSLCYATTVCGTVRSRVMIAMIISVEGAMDDTVDAGRQPELYTSGPLRWTGLF